MHCHWILLMFMDKNQVRLAVVLEFLDSSFYKCALPIVDLLRWHHSLSPMTIVFQLLPILEGKCVAKYSYCQRLRPTCMPRHQSAVIFVVHHQENHSVHMNNICANRRQLRDDPNTSKLIKWQANHFPLCCSTAVFCSKKKMVINRFECQWFEWNYLSPVQTWTTVPGASWTPFWNTSCQTIDLRDNCFTISTICWMYCSSSCSYLVKFLLFIKSRIFVLDFQHSKPTIYQIIRILIDCNTSASLNWCAI